MLQVYHSNRLELLFEIMCAQRAAHSLSDPFQADQILVANPGIGRWLSLQLSDREGIAANIDYPLPASYIWKLYREHLPEVPERSAFNKPRLQWTLMQLLEKLPDTQIYSPLHRYLAAAEAEQSTLKRVQLAAKIADVFDQYLVYRPDWLMAWERGENPANATGEWQAGLWRELRQQLSEPHRATLHAAFCEAANKGKLIQSALPERLYIFNVVSIPPSYLDVLTALSKHIPIDMYLLNPSVEYWDEITDRKRQLKLRQKQGSDTPLDDGNPLLAATGRLGQNALRLLHERGQFIHENNFSVPADQDGRLAQLQREILTLTQPSERVAPQMGLDLGPDYSLEIHSAHSILREVQILHDQLLARFERIPNLGPADIIVMVPNVDNYTPAVAAVFGSADSERYIPWEIADRSLNQTDPVVNLLRTLLDLPQSQFKASEVLGWLTQPVLARSFELLEPESQRLLARWVLDSGARRQLGEVPLAGNTDCPLNSWAFALRRLLAGYALSEEDEAIAGVYASSALEGGEAVLLGRLIECLDRLATWRASLAQARPISQWLDVFNRLVADLLDPDDDEAFAIQQVRECMASLSENAELAGYEDALQPSAMLALLDNALAGTSAKTQRFLTGRVTISSMVPLRSVPFRVVCLLGLNDGEFPRQNKPVSFDLIPGQPRMGDRSVREDDHYLFLEALLSARDELYLSWIGHDPKDNSDKTPSVLLAELMEYFAHDSEKLQVLHHPLQAFSPRYFSGANSRLFSFAKQWLPQSTEAAAEGSAPELLAGDLQLSALLQFWRDPPKRYCQDVLHLGLGGSQRLAPDTEPFDLDTLENYQQRDALIAEALAIPPTEPEQLMAAYVGRGELPHGRFGQRLFENNYDEAAQFAYRVRSVSEEPLAPIALDLTIEGWRISGQFDAVHQAELGKMLLLKRPGGFKGTDFLSLVLMHLLGCAAAILDVDSVFVSRDKNRRMQHIPPEKAVELLLPWLHMYAEGQSWPLPFFPDSSWQQVGEKPEKVSDKWLGGDFTGPGESSREAVQLLWPRIEHPQQIPEFVSLAEKLITPVLPYLIEEKS